jgi:peptide/nickel transport system ATP-binding protein
MIVAEGLARTFDVSRPWLQRQLAREPRRLLRAVDGVSFEIPRGTTLSLVGESGCGKSTVARLAVGLYAPTAGQMLFEGQPLSAARANPAMRRRMQMIFQDPYASLNPRWRVRDIVAEPIRAFKLLPDAAVPERVGELLRQVGLSPLDGEKYPHEFSGGQRQRISIARALSVHPEFVLCDEPLSALDVSVQAQVVNILQDLQQELGLTYLFIAHDLSMVRHISSRIGVMYLGKLVEVAPANELYQRPAHPYTRALLAAVPQPDPRIRNLEDATLRGDIPGPTSALPGCKFCSRCPHAMPVCQTQEPAMQEIAPGHFAACWLFNM